MKRNRYETPTSLTQADIDAIAKAVARRLSRREDPEKTVRLRTVTQVANLLQVGEQTVRRYLKAGVLRSAEITGGERRVRLTDVEELVEESLKREQGG